MKYLHKSVFINAVGKVLVKITNIYKIFSFSIFKNSFLDFEKSFLLLSGLFTYGRNMRSDIIFDLRGSPSFSNS